MCVSLCAYMSIYEYYKIMTNQPISAAYYTQINRYSFSLDLCLKFLTVEGSIQWLIISWMSAVSIGGLGVVAFLPTCLYPIALMLETVITSKSWASFYQTTWCQIPEDSLIHTAVRTWILTKNFSLKFWRKIFTLGTCLGIWGEDNFIGLLIRDHLKFSDVYLTL
jgi:hypothetical protein